MRVSIHCYRIIEEELTGLPEGNLGIVCMKQLRSCHYEQPRAFEEDLRRVGSDMAPTRFGPMVWPRVLHAKASHAKSNLLVILSAASKPSVERRPPLRVVAPESLTSHDNYQICILYLPHSAHHSIPKSHHLADSLSKLQRLRRSLWQYTLWRRKIYHSVGRGQFPKADAANSRGKWFSLDRAAIVTLSKWQFLYGLQLGACSNSPVRALFVGISSTRYNMEDWPFGIIVATHCHRNESIRDQKTSRASEANKGFPAATEP